MKHKLCGALAFAALLTAGTIPAHAQNPSTNKPAPPRRITIGKLDTPGTIIAAVWNGKVVEVVDANTLRVERPAKKPNGDKTTENVLVKLWGIVPPHGDEAAAAKEYIQKSVKGKTVRVQAQTRANDGTLTADVFALPDIPPYGVAQGRVRRLGDSTVLTQPRPLAAPELPVNFPSLGQGLLRAGLAKWNKSEAPEASHLSGAEAAAIKDKVGVWAASIQ